jgi:hypothetical protein
MPKAPVSAIIANPSAEALAKACWFPQATERGLRRTDPTSVRWHPR